MRKEYDELVTTWGIHPKLAELLRRLMLDRVLGLASALSLVVGAATAPAGPAAEVEFTFQDPEIIESSGLVATGNVLPDRQRLR